MKHRMDKKFCEFVLDDVQIGIMKAFNSLEKELREGSLIASFESGDPLLDLVSNSAELMKTKVCNFINIQADACKKSLM